MNLQSRLVVGWLCGCLSMHSAARAAPPVDANPFVGVNMSFTQVGYDVLANDTGVGHGFQVGLLYPESRVYASLDFHEWSDSSGVVIRAHYDRLFPLHNPIRAFVGVNGSLVDFELAERYQPEKFDTGPGVGVQAGVVFPLSKRWAFESGLRFDRFWVSSNVREKALDIEGIRLRSTASGYVSLSYVSW